jgi:hypothetical protein
VKSQLERIKLASKLISNLRNLNGQPYLSDWIKKNILKISREDEIKMIREERIKKLNKINENNK